MAADRRKELLIRAYMVMFGFVLFAGMILFKVFKISVVEGDKWRNKGEVNVKWLPVKADRGNIYAEDGSMLATSLQFFEIRMDLLTIDDDDFDKGIDSLSIGLARMNLGKNTAKEWKQALTEARYAGIHHGKPGMGYYFIGKGLDFEQFKILRTLPILRLGQHRGGLIVERYTRRDKPYRELASRTIGENRENADKIGLEGFYDKVLEGETEQKLMKRIPGNIWIPVQDPSEFEAKKGDDVLTTIDIHIQDIAHDHLLEAVDSFNAEAGVAIVMEVKTGKIKAISNIGRTKSGILKETYNRAIGRLSEPGSTFKVASVMALLEDGYVDLDTKVDLNGGKKKFYNLWMRDSRQHGLGIVNLQRAFEISSNVGIASLANKFYNNDKGKLKFFNRLQSFGLKNKTGVELKGEATPTIKHPVDNKEIWYGTTVPWMSHGYELMLTPLQTLSLFNTVANGGKLMKPYLVSEIQQQGVTRKKFGPKVRSQAIASEKTISTMQYLLRSVVEQGTGKIANSDVVDIAGKTGTASVDYSQGPDKKKYNASFAGYFPASAPKYSMIVVVYKPEVAYYGSTVCGPVFRKIAEDIFVTKDDMFQPINTDEDLLVNNDLPDSRTGYSLDFKRVFDYVGMGHDKPRNRWVSVDPSSDKMNFKKKEILKSEVPDVRGMGLRDALYVLENMGLEVSHQGYGKVRNQSLKPGNKIDGQLITIYLN